MTPRKTRPSRMEREKTNLRRRNQNHQQLRTSPSPINNPKRRRRKTRRRSKLLNQQKRRRRSKSRKLSCRPRFHSAQNHTSSSSLSRNGTTRYHPSNRSRRLRALFHQANFLLSPRKLISYTKRMSAPSSRLRRRMHRRPASSPKSSNPVRCRIG